jgi:hypothetical protein
MHVVAPGSTDADVVAPLLYTSARGREIGSAGAWQIAAPGAAAVAACFAAAAKG